MINPAALLPFKLQIHRVQSFRFISLKIEARAKLNIDFMLLYKTAGLV